MLTDACNATVRAEFGGKYWNSRKMAQKKLVTKKEVGKLLKELKKEEKEAITATKEFDNYKVKMIWNPQKKLMKFNLGKYPSGIKPEERKKLKKISNDIDNSLMNYSMSFFDLIIAKNTLIGNIKRINSTFSSWARNARGIIYDQDLVQTRNQVKDAHAKYVKASKPARAKVGKAAKVVIAAIDAMLKALAKLKQERSAEMRPYISGLLNIKNHAKIYT